MRDRIREFTINTGVLAGFLAVLVVGGLGDGPAPVTAGAAQWATAYAATPVGGLNSGWDLPQIDHASVDHFVLHFSEDAAARSRIALYLERASEWAPYLQGRLAARQLPQDLLFMVLIESGFNPKAVSPAGAVGLWQFMPATARQYGLTVDGRADERTDPELATAAALEYLEHLHDRFGSWFIAAAAYNAGEGRLARTMDEHLGRRVATSDRDYFRIRAHLPLETQDYVPKILAVGRIAKDPARYGFSAPPGVRVAAR